jgi:hypothetical protein
MNELAVVSWMLHMVRKLLTYRYKEHSFFDDEASTLCFGGLVAACWWSGLCPVGLLFLCFCVFVVVCWF